MSLRGVMLTMDHSDAEEILKNVSLICEPIQRQRDLVVWIVTEDIALSLLWAEYTPKHIDELPLFCFQFFLYGYFFSSL